MNAVSVEISANFGFFQWEKTKGDNRITNLFISKTEVLGLLGAVIGLDGYAQSTFKSKHSVTSSPFYEELSGLIISVIPKEKPELFEDHLIHRHMNYVNTKGALMVKMTGLIKPHYKLVIAKGDVEDAVFEKLVHYLQNGWSEFIPYMGKNQYPVEITNFELEELVSVEKNQKTKIHSIYKEAFIVTAPKVRERQLIENDYHYAETLRSFQKDSPLFLNEKHLWSSFDVQLNQDIWKTKQEEQIVFL